MGSRNTKQNAKTPLPAPPKPFGVPSCPPGCVPSPPVGGCPPGCIPASGNPNQGQQAIAQPQGQYVFNPATQQYNYVPNPQPYLAPSAQQPIPQGQYMLNPATQQYVFVPNPQPYLAPSAQQPIPQGQYVFNPATQQYNYVPNSQPYLAPSAQQPLPQGQYVFNPATQQYVFIPSSYQQSLNPSAQSSCLPGQPCSPGQPCYQPTTMPNSQQTVIQTPYQPQIVYPPNQSNMIMVPGQQTKINPAPVPKPFVPTTPSASTSKQVIIVGPNPCPPGCVPIGSILSNSEPRSRTGSNVSSA